MWIPGRLFQRAPFLVGIGVGGLATLAIGVALSLQGTINASALYVGLAPEVRVWDRHGLEDPRRWELLTSPQHSFASARDVYLETAEVRVYYAGTADAPFTFAVQPKGEELIRFPEHTPPSQGYDPGPATLSFPNNQELSVSLRAGAARGRVLIRAQWRGFALTMEGDPDKQQLRLASFTGPWVLHDEIASVAAGTVSSKAQQVELSPGHGYVLSLPGSDGSGIVAGSRQRLSITADAAGFRHEVLLRPARGGKNRVFVGTPEDRLRGNALRSEPHNAVAATTESGGWFLLTVVVASRRQDRFVRLTKGRQELRVGPNPSVVALLNLEGLGGPEGMRAQALSGFAVP